MKPISRTAVAFLAAVALAAGLAGCSGTENADQPEAADTQPTEQAEPEAEPEPEPEPIVAVTSGDYFTLDGVYLDSSYEDPNGSNGKMLYVFYTLTAPDSGLQTTSNGVSLRICDEDQVRAGNIIGGEIAMADLSASGDLMASYYYDNTVQTVKYGTEFKVVSTYLVTPAQMEAGHFLLFEDTDVPGIEEIVVPTEDVIPCASPEEIAEKADPAGVEAARAAHEPADAETAQAVSSAIDGYEFYEIYNGLSLKFYFEAPDYFEEHTTGENNSGTYVVQKGYIACTYDNGKTVDIPWEWKEDGSIGLDISGAMGL